MTNLAKWNFFLKDLESPEVYILWGFYYLISACLQRRVWWGDETFQPLYPNIYVVLIGPPGVGKSRVAVLAEALIKGLTKVEGKREIQLIPIAPNAMSVEWLSLFLASCTREVVNSENKIVYVHASMTFVSEELGVLINKDSSNTINLLNKCWDCGDYTRMTKNAGQDIVKNSCISFIGGTTLKLFEDQQICRLLHGGFSARALFVWADKERFKKFKIALSAEQKQALTEIIAHLHVLTKLYGEAKFTPEAEEYLRQWYEDTDPKEFKLNQSEYLLDYYKRKKVHAIKLAMLIHFAESTEMLVSVESCKEALRILRYTEISMHKAFPGSGRNPLHEIGERILEYLRGRGPAAMKKLKLHFDSDANGDEIDVIMSHLRSTGQVIYDSENQTFIAVGIDPGVEI